jgi:cysteine desulfurase/selenocysteine lyase
MRTSSMLPATGVDHPALPLDPATGAVKHWRRHFPALAQRAAGRRLAYLDSAATTHRPRAVADAIAEFYARDNGNPGRGLHYAARSADERYEEARARVARFLNARDRLEVVFVRGTTEAINLVASSWGAANLRPGDEVILSVAEHYSNLVPWQLAAKRMSARLRFLDIDEEGHLRLDQLEELLSERTKLVAVSHVSNVLGVLNPVRQIVERAHRAGAVVLVDGAQSVPHVVIDVQALGCDFLAFSGHTMLGPMGVGALWARREILDAMPPYQGGGDMAYGVTLDAAKYAPGALKFEAGTPNVSGAVGLVAVIDFLDEIGFDVLREHERRVTQYAIDRFRVVDGLRLLGPSDANEKVSLFAFTLDGVSVPDIVRRLDERGVCVRGGDLAALPLLRRFGLEAAVRASAYLYTTTDEIDQLVDGLVALRR